MYCNLCSNKEFLERSITINNISREEKNAQLKTIENWKREGKRVANLNWTQNTEGLRKEFSKTEEEEK